MVNSTDIKEHMDVVSSDGKRIGTVDHMEGSDRIKLTKADSPDGHHHLIPLAWVRSVDARVHLSKSADDTMKNWQHAA